MLGGYVVISACMYLTCAILSDVYEIHVLVGSKVENLISCIKCTFYVSTPSLLLMRACLGKLDNFMGDLFFTQNKAQTE